VLVTGATGFLGRAAADAMLHAGHRVLRGARVAPPSPASGQSWVAYGDIGPDTRWETALAGIDTIVHLAGLAHRDDAARTFDRINAQGTDRLASAAARAGVRRLVLVSSALVHGDAGRGRPFTENDEPAPVGPYARSKLDAERLLVAAGQGSGLEWVILRPPMVYGAGARGNFLRLAKLVRSGLPLPLGAATAPRTFIGVDNLADALVRCATHPDAAGRTFLVGDAETTSTADLVGRMAAILGRRARLLSVSPSLMRTTFRLAGRERDFHRLFDPLELDTSLIRAVLGWSPLLSLDEGLRRAIC
jgi:nucleoside-diphosphate-sugar epimerase